jgi:hypothetical protein
MGLAQDIFQYIKTFSVLPKTMQTYNYRRPGTCPAKANN